MTSLICQQASMLISNALNIIQFSFIHESLKFTSSLSHKNDLSITQHKIKTIITEAAEDAVINVLHCFNLLFYEFIYTFECQSSIFISTMLIQIILIIIFSFMTLLISTLSYTCMNIIKSKNIDYFDSKLYTELIISDSKHDSIIHDVFLFINCIHEIVNYTFNLFIFVEFSF